MPHSYLPTLTPDSGWTDILISDTAKVSHILQAMQSQLIAVIADYDRTCTKAGNPSLISVLRSRRILSDDYTIAAYALADYFHPIETSTTHDQEYIRGKMQEWWTLHLSLLSDQLSPADIVRAVGEEIITSRLSQMEDLSDEMRQKWEQAKNHTEKIMSNLTKQDLDTVSNSGAIIMRDQIREVFEVTAERGIPFIIFSANGLGTDSIRSHLDYHDISHPHIHIISNSFIWDETGRVIGYREPVIHVMNKEVSAIKAIPAIYAHIEQRKHIILIGDSLGDAHMADGHKADIVLKIGMLTKLDPEESDIQAYQEAFDIVLVGDGDMSPLLQILDQIQENH